MSLKPAALMLALVGLISACPCWCAPLLPAKPAKNILVIHEGWDTFPSNAVANAQLQEVFDRTLDPQFFQEYMDEWRLGLSLPEIAAALHRKYAAHKIDLIFTVGFTPFDLLRSQGSKYFPGVPVVFVNVGDFELPKGGMPQNMTGVLAHADLAETIELAMRLQPETRHLFFVAGNSEYERRSISLLQPQLSGFHGLDVNYLSDLTLEKLLVRVSKLPEHSTIFFLTLVKDQDGRSYVPTYACTLLSEAANAPVYALPETDMGRGIVGGSLYSTKRNVRAAAELGLQVLQGVDPRQLPIRPGPPNEITVDWRQLQRWHIPESRLPPHTVVLFGEPGIWKPYRGYIVTAVIIVLLQTLLIGALGAQVRRRTIAERTVKRRLEFETLISEMSARFINLPSDRLSTEIECSLERLRTFLNVDRIAFYSRSDPGMDFRALHYAIPEKKDLLFPIVKEAQFPWAMRQLQQGHALLVENMAKLPPEAVAERELASHGVQSFALSPVTASGSVLGLLMLSMTTRQRGWPEDLVRQLQILGDIFYQAVMRKRAEEAARESEERFALVADSAPMLVWMAGSDKRSTYFNKGWLDFTGRTLEQQLGGCWTAGIHPEDLERCLDGYTQAFDAKSEFKSEYRLRRHDGQYRWMMNYGVPRYSPDGSFCGFIGSCIDITDLKASQQEMEHLSGRLIHAQEEERKRVARELHDNFGQRLVVLSMELAQHLSTPDMPPIQAWLRDLGANLKEISRAMNVTAHQLHSSHLEVLGLVSAVQGLCFEFSRQHGIEVAFSHANMPASISAEVALCLFRVLQESLQNIAKHSGALSCRVELTGAAERIHLCVADPGVGFDSARLKLKPGLGFVSMRERLRLVGGQMVVESQPSHGTRLDIHVPVAAMTTAA
jgi:PAS domain S-box-containing protein